VPVLVAGGRVLADSTDILRWVDEQGRAPPLFTGDEAAALEDDLDRRLGPATRRLAYFHILPARARVKAFLRQHGRPWEAQATRVLFPVVRAAIVRGLRVDAEGAARSRRVIDEIFADVAARLADGRRYLLGDRFSAADLTFGALAYPVLVPGGAIARGLVPPLHELPASVGPLVDELRATAAGRFALRLWEERPG
jgi:glutathione S-transferase